MQDEKFKALHTYMMQVFRIQELLTKRLRKTLNIRLRAYLIQD